MTIIERKDVESMKIKDGCEISISGRNKRRILLVVVILSIIALLTPVSLAATAGRSDIEITDQSVNTDKITAPLLNPAPSALILSILDKEDTVDQGKITDQSVNTDKNEPTVAENDDKEPVKDTPPNKIPEGLPNNAENRFISVINELFFINETELNIDSCYSTILNDDFTIFDLEVGDILFWDAGKRYKHGIYRFIPASLSGHCAIYTGPRYNETTGEYLGNCVDTVPTKNVRFCPLRNDNYAGEDYFAVGRVTNATDSQKEAAAQWAVDLATNPPKPKLYQEFWQVGTGARKWFESNTIVGTNNVWYCSELVWAAYYNTSINTSKADIFIGYFDQNGPWVHAADFDIDEDGWSRLLILPFMGPAVSPLEIFEDDDVDIVFRQNTTSKSDSSCNFTSVYASAYADDSSSNSNSNTLIYSDSEGAALNYLNSGSNSNILTNPSSSLNTNTLTSKLLNLD